MAKDDGSLSFEGRVTPLMELMRRRRSYRKYEAEPVPAASIDYILRCVAELQERCGFSAPRFSVVVRGPEFDRVVRAAARGAVLMVNPWLPFTRASHLLLCAVVYPEESRALAQAIEQAAMAMQVALLAATEVGCASCWMAGINHERIEEAYRLPDGARLIAMSPLGTPPRRMGLSWDTMDYHLMSKRRKPLPEIWMKEGWR